MVRQGVAVYSTHVYILPQYNVREQGGCYAGKVFSVTKYIQYLRYRLLYLFQNVFISNINDIGLSIIIKVLLFLSEILNNALKP